MKTLCHFKRLAGAPYLGVPFFDTTTSSEGSSFLAVPQRFRGAAELKNTTLMQGAELNGTFLFRLRIEMWSVIGLSLLEFEERLKFLADSPSVNIPEEIYLVEDHSINIMIAMDY